MGACLLRGKYRNLLIIATTVIAISACKSSQNKGIDDESTTMSTDAASGSMGSFFGAISSSLQSELQKGAVTKAKAYGQSLMTDRAARTAAIQAFCSRFPPHRRMSCINHSQNMGDMSAGVAQSLQQDIAEAAQGIEQAVVNPDKLAVGLVNIGSQVVRDPRGSLIHLKDQAAALRDDMIECWNSGAVGKGKVIGHAALILVPEAKAADMAAGVSAAGKAAQIGARAGAVITEVRKGDPGCTSSIGRDASGNVVLESTLTVPTGTVLDRNAPSDYIQTE